MQSSVRPVNAAFRMPLAGMEIRGSVPNQTGGLIIPLRVPGFTEPDLSDHLPLHSKTSSHSQRTAHRNAYAAAMAGSL